MTNTENTVDPGSALLAPSSDTRTFTCPACGAHLDPPVHGSLDVTISTLLAVCDVLVIKALEKIGNILTRGDKGRYFEIGDRPYHLAHTLWPASDEIVTRTLKGAWEVVPLLLGTHGHSELNAAVVVSILDSYVHDLVVTGEPHDINALAYRVRGGLGLPVLHVYPAIPPSG